MNLKELLSDKRYSALYNVQYQYFGLVLDKDFDIKGSDSIEILDIDEEKIAYIVTREIHFEPKNLFEISVSYQVEYFFKEGIKGAPLLDKDEIKNQLYEDGEFFSDDEMGRVSQIISELTGTFGRTPLVTVPSFHGGSIF